MALPLGLIIVALLSGAAVAYGANPRWAELEHGLDVILWTRRLLWPLVGLTTLSALGLIVLTIAGKRRAWWLIGLVPVIALFSHRFAAGRAEELAVAESPAFVAVAQASFMKDDDWLVSVRFGDQTYAYPYAALFAEPVVVQTDHDQRMVLFWNAYANRVLAFKATMDVKGRDLEVVSTPANSILVYNSRQGEFISGVTGLTTNRTKPAGLGAALATSKTTWARWRAANPDGQVMKPSGRLDWRGPTPTGPIQPAYAAFGLPLGHKSPIASTQPAAGRRQVAIIGAQQPAAVDLQSLSNRPNPLQADGQPIVALYDESSGLRAYVRKVEDMVLRMEAHKDARRADVRMRDLETDCQWSVGGVAVGGNAVFRGRKLAPVVVDTAVDYDIMKWWLPELQLYVEPAPAPAKPAATAPSTKKADAKSVKKKTPKKPAR